jgi:hypothetical protein
VRAKPLGVVERRLLRARGLIEKAQVRGRAGRSERTGTGFAGFTARTAFNDHRSAAAAAIRAARRVVT